MTAPGGAGDELPGNGKRRRVLMIPAYASNPYCHLLASALRDRGWEVTTCGIGGWLPLFRAVRSQGRPDLVHLQWQHRFFLKEDERLLSAAVRTVLFFLQWLALRLTGVRFVWTVHNLVNHERKFVDLELLACRILARLVDGIIVHCHDVVDRVSEAYRVPRSALDVISHGHYIGWYPGPPNREQARKRIGLPADGRILLHFGQIRPYKGVEDLLTAFSEIEDPAATLIVAGDPRFEWLESQIRDRAAGDSRIQLELRFLPEKELIEFLAATDVVVLPYTDILTSGSAILAASVKRPVVAPDVGCLRGFPDRAILRYPPDEKGALFDALERACHEPVNEIGRCAYEHVKSFAWEEVSRRTGVLYEEISRAS